MRLVTLQSNTRQTSLPELGRIRLGDVKTDPKKPGSPLPYFRVDFNPAYKQLEPIWNALYPQPPYRLDNIYMAYEKAEDSFSSAYEEWAGAKVLARRCDGATICLYHDSRTQTYQKVQMPCQCQASGKQVCRMVGRLSFIVKDFFEFAASKGVHALGRFVMTTGSKHNISRIDALLQGVELQYGTVKRIPFVLERTTEEVSTPIPASNGREATRIMKKHYLLTIRTADAFAPFAADALLETGPKPAALPAPASSPALLPESIEPETDETIIDSDHFDVPERRDVDLILASVQMDKNKRRYIRFSTHQGIEVYRRSRDLFIDAGWIQHGDWQELGDYDLPHIPAIVEMDEAGYWQVVHVFPAE
jgi:hypothetical protein